MLTTQTYITIFLILLFAMAPGYFLITYFLDEAKSLKTKLSITILLVLSNIFAIAFLSELIKIFPISFISLFSLAGLNFLLLTMLDYKKIIKRAPKKRALFSFLYPFSIFLPLAVLMFLFAILLGLGQAGVFLNY